MSPTNRISPDPAEAYLQLFQVAGFDDHGSITFREVQRNRPPIGYRRLRGWERPVFVVAFVAAVSAQLLRHTLGQGLSIAIGGLAAIVFIVLFFRLFIYRPDK